MHDERALIRAVIDGDSRAADELVSRFARLVHALLRDAGLPVDLQDDAFQAVFVKLWDDHCRRLRAWRGEGSFASYLAPVVRHTAIDLLRGAPKEICSETDPATPSHEPSPEERTAARERREKLMRCVERLSARDRQLFALRHAAGMTYDQVARRLGMTVNAVGVALFRLSQRLEKLMQDEPGGSGRPPGSPERPAPQGP